MGFLSGLTSAVVKTALTPIAIVKDAGNVALGIKADATKNHVESIGEDLADALDL